LRVGKKSRILIFGMNFFKNILGILRSKEDRVFLNKIRKITEFKPKNLEIYRKAFTHSSVKKTDQNGNIINYERLEFLGDSIIGSIIATYLYRKVPEQNEGYLTKMKSKIVNRKNLNKLAKKLNLIELIIIRRNSQKKIGEKIYGDIFEAFVGAIYLDKGYLACEKFIHKKLIEPYVDISKLEREILSYKGLLIEWCQKYKKNYVIETEETTKNNSIKRFFLAKLYIDENQISESTATSKKQAEEIASKRAYYTLKMKVKN